jgi:hypothetical protein
MRATILGMRNMRCAISAAITLRLSPSVTATKPSRVGTGALEHVVVDAGADFDLAAEAVAQPLERGGILVHDDDVVFVGDEQLGEGRSYTRRSRR